MSSIPFDFIARPATIEAITINKQGPKDGRIVAVVLSITAEDLHPRNLAALLVAPLAQVEQAFWRIEEIDALDIAKGDKVDRRFLGIESFACARTYTKQHELTVANLPPVRVEKLDKFKATPLAGQTVVMSFHATILEPSETWMSEAMKIFRETCECTLEQDAELPLDRPTSASDKARRKAKDKADKTAEMFESAGGPLKNAPAVIEGEARVVTPGKRPGRAQKALSGPAKKSTKPKALPPPDKKSGAGGSNVTSFRNPKKE